MLPVRLLRQVVLPRRACDSIPRHADAYLAVPMAIRRPHGSAGQWLALAGRLRFWRQPSPAAVAASRAAGAEPSALEASKSWIGAPGITVLMACL